MSRNVNFRDIDENVVENPYGINDTSNLASTKIFSVSQSQ